MLTGPALATMGQPRSGPSRDTSSHAVIEEPLRAGVLFDGPSEQNTQLLEKFLQTFGKALHREVVVDDRDRVTGDYSLNESRDRLRELRSRSDLDLVIAFGVFAGEAALSVDQPLPGSNGVPVIAPFVLPRTTRSDGPLPENVIALELPLRAREDIARIARLFPVDAVEIHVPKPYMELARTVAEATSWNTDPPVILTTDTDGIWNGGSRHIDAATQTGIYLLPHPHVTQEEMRLRMARYHDSGSATFAALGRNPHDTGVVGVLREYSVETVSLRSALEFRELIASGTVLGSVQSVRARRVLLLDREALRRSGMPPHREALLHARFVDRHDAPADITLPEAIQLSLDQNLDLAARAAHRDAQSTEVRNARSKILPQLDASTTFRVLDNERAESSFAPDQLSAIGTLTLRQVLWSEPAWANVRIQEMLSASEDFQYEQYRQDTAESAALAYFDFLRTHALVELRQDEVDQLQFHLDRARTRREVGAAGPGDVYRFRSELALAQRELTGALALQQQSQMQLNRILNRPQRGDLRPLERGLTDPLEVLPMGRLFFSVTDLQALQNLEESLLRYAFEASSELAALNEAIAARTRERRMRSNAFWSPTVALMGQVEHQYWSGGTSADTQATLNLAPGVLPPTTIDTEDLISGPGDLQWSIGIQASIPLYSGGQRRAALDRADANLRELTRETESISRQVEQRLRSAFVRTVAAAESMLHVREAADAAEQALTLASRAYDTGMINAAELVDTQNHASAAERLVQDATYEYLRDFTQLLRAMGAVDSIGDPAQRVELQTVFFTPDGKEDR